MQSQRQIQILYVDDEPDFIDLTTTFLEREDDRFTIKTATSADEGLERIDDRPPDCVVSDYNMPGMDGLELLQAVREEHSDLPFILLTGKGSEAVASDAISAGVTNYLQKQGDTEQYRLLANRIQNAVTAQRDAEEATRQRDLMEQAEILGATGGWELEVESETLRLTDGIKRIYGVETGRNLSLEEVMELYEPGSQEKIRRVINDAVENGYGEAETLYLQTTDGKNRVVQGTAERVKTEGDSTVLRGVIRDITDREERKSELREYETVIEAISDAVYVMDEEGRFTYVNDDFVELVGYDREIILGSTPSLIKDDDAVNRAEQQLGKLLSKEGSETLTFEVTIHPRDSDPVVCQDHIGILPREGNQFTGSAGILRDITEKKAREQALQTVSRQYETLVANFPDGAVFLFNKDLQYIQAGGEELAAVGLSTNDIRGATPNDLFPEELADETVRYYRETLDGASHTFEQEYQGDHYWIRTVPIRTSDEDVVHGMAVSQNITERAERQRELERQNERLEEFASVISHDLRNPLQVADGRLELIRQESESDHIDDVAQALDRMEALIEDLLTLAREGEQLEETRPVGLANVAENSWQTVNTEQAALETNTSWTVKADQSRLQQLFENLYRNAVEHGGDDVTVSLGEMNDGFYVADTGPGIPEGEREDIFEAGYSTSEDGTGFGLRIVKQVADAHGWEVAVTESEQGGARFEITGVERANY